MKEWFEGKTVAIVGNAESLIRQRYGQEIDQAEVVVRINRGGHQYTSFSIQMGTRLDVWCMQNIKQNKMFFHKPHTSNVLKMQMDTIDVSPHFIELVNLVYDKEMCKELSSHLSKKPSTGLRVLDYVYRSNPKEVYVYGFDWKETFSWHEKRVCVAHDFKEERNYCEQVFLKNPWFIVRK
jgi:hypothetical protein